MCGYKTGYFVLVVGKLKEREIREYCSLAGCGGGSGREYQS